MALTKVQKTGITDNAIDADKIEDGTIVAADIAPGTITNAKLAGSIANDKLANSSITVNGTSVSLGGSVSAGKVSWQSVKTADFNAVAGEGYFVDTNSVGAVTATLPASPSAGDTIAFKDYAANFGTNSLTIARNGNNIQGAANDSEILTNRASVVLVYIDATKGWLYTNESNVGELIPTFITATGGTTVTSGDYKYHIFTGDGTFSVSSVGNPLGSSGVTAVIQAGGGGGGQYYGGGGGGGGTVVDSDGYPVSASPGTYPITVGAGGAGSPNNATLGTDGTNSTGLGYTAAGGGKGGGRTPSPASGTPGGNGGGNGGLSPTGGSATQPGISNSGATNYGFNGRNNPNGGGGGGSGGGNGLGGPDPDTNAQTGMYGLNVAPVMAAYTVFSPTVAIGDGRPGAQPGLFVGGGGGGQGVPTNFGGGGPNPVTANGAGTANSGGGGRGDNSVAAANAGGKGVVIIKYKFQ